MKKREEEKKEKKKGKEGKGKNNNLINISFDIVKKAKISQKSNSSLR